MPEKSKTIVKSFSAKSAAIDVEKRQIRVLASSPDVDRDNERIPPSAFEPHLAQFMTNPVFLVCHRHSLDSGEPTVIGRVVKIWIDTVGVWAIVQFAEGELAEKFWILYRDGFMKAVSIGFLAIKWHDSIENGKHVRVYDEIELIEISAVAVPSNRAALTRSKANKLAFVEGKRQEREDEQILKAVRSDYAERGLDFDKDCDEFVGMLLGVIPLSWEKSSPRDDMKDKEPDYGARFKKHQA